MACAGEVSPASGALNLQTHARSGFNRRRGEETVPCNNGGRRPADPPAGVDEADAPAYHDEAGLARGVGVVVVQEPLMRSRAAREPAGGAPGVPGPLRVHEVACAGLEALVGRLQPRKLRVVLGDGPGVFLQGVIAHAGPCATVVPAREPRGHDALDLGGATHQGCAARRLWNRTARSPRHLLRLGVHVHAVARPVQRHPVGVSVHGPADGRVPVLLGRLPGGRVALAQEDPREPRGG